MAILQFLRAFGQRTLKNNLRALPRKLSNAFSFRGSKRTRGTPISAGLGVW
jgi:hypothetical protein